MPEPDQLRPPNPPAETAEHDDGTDLRPLSRSPHPYHRQSSELLHPADRFDYNRAARGPSSPHLTGPEPLGRSLWFPKDSPFASDSGTEADDEHFLKGLPAPRVRHHKGLRGLNEAISGASTPLPSPTIPEHHVAELGEKLCDDVKHERRPAPDRIRQARVAVRRYIEVALLASLVVMVVSSREVQPTVKLWFQECLLSLALMAALVAIYPLRLMLWAHFHRGTKRWIPLRVPKLFDPAAILYPQSITILTTLLLAANKPTLVLPNIVLCLCSLPEQVIPFTLADEPLNIVHWLVTCAPLYWATSRGAPYLASTDEAWSLVDSQDVPPALATLLYPLHQSLRDVLRRLTTTSLLPAELELFSIALINLLLLSSSPQMRILKALLWVGGLGVLVTCGHVITWGISLARVPKWRFKRDEHGSRYPFIIRHIHQLLLWMRTRPRPHDRFIRSSADVPSSEDSDPEGTLLKRRSLAPFPPFGDGPCEAEDAPDNGQAKIGEPPNGFSVGRRNTLPALVSAEKTKKLSQTHTPGGRRRRTASTSIRGFFKLTQSQAATKKWAYAGYLYLAIITIILGPVRSYITRYALDGHEAIGWALGYVFGNINWFRLKVTAENLNWWIPLPTRVGPAGEAHLGTWMEYVRLATLGAASTRLLIGAYWLAILVLGLLTVYQLKGIYEVDTRRKVFHFMMVGMFLPATYVDPTFAALSLAVALAVFLIVDLLRASQLPPLSKPIANFLAPYVDGRDFRGPVVISHIFLLIGCAIPLWLTLASLPRSGEGATKGWDVDAREVSMVSGVVCVGLGDAAASLIGRRWGHRKWLWGGGKSLEGSAAFAVAVFAGLLAASLWLRVGGWSASGSGPLGWAAEVRGAGVCASVASLTEAVLTGGNDNVIVPVVLWTCVKSLGV